MSPQQRREISATRKRSFYIDDQGLRPKPLKRHTAGIAVARLTVGDVPIRRRLTMQTDPTIDPIADPSNQPLDAPEEQPRPLPDTPPDTDPLAPGSSPEDEDALGLPEDDS